MATTVDFSTTSSTTGFSSLSSSSSFSYNSSTKTLDISSSTVQGVTRYNLYKSNNLIFEAKLTFKADSASRKHFGIWLTFEDNRKGIRLNHLDNFFGVSYWYTDTSEISSGLAQVNDGSISSYDGKIVPTVTIGSDYTFKIFVQATLTFQSASLESLVRFTVNDVIIHEFTVLTSTLQGILTGFYPGIFTYGSTLGVKYLIMDEGISWPGTPVSSVGTLITKSKATTAYTFYTGPSTISGTITKNGSLYPYASVSLLTTDCLLLRKTFANASGEYSFNNIDTSVKYLIISQDYTLEYNPVIYRT